MSPLDILNIAKDADAAECRRAIGLFEARLRELEAEPIFEAMRKAGAEEIRIGDKPSQQTISHLQKAAKRERERIDNIDREYYLGHGPDDYQEPGGQIGETVDF